MPGFRSVGRGRQDPVYQRFVVVLCGDPGLRLSRLASSGNNKLSSDWSVDVGQTYLWIALRETGGRGVG